MLTLSVRGRPLILDHTRLPFLEIIRDYQSRRHAIFSTPGHKLGRAVDDETLDLVGREVFAADPLINYVDMERTRKAAEALAADAWGADLAFHLLHGSSGGNHAFLLAALGPGDEVIVSRNVHQSILTGLVLSGAKPVYVTPRIHAEFDIGLGVEPSAIAAALDDHPAAKLVVVVSPTYSGISSDLPAIADVCHARDVPLFVDEAWGAHFSFHPAFPPSAMMSGADGAVTSVHKLLACLQQGALLLVSGPRVDHGRLAGAVRMTQTTSPNMPMLASLDGGRRSMALEGEARLERALTLAAAAAERLRAIPGIEVLDSGRLGWPLCDPTRLLIDVAALGLTGHEVERRLLAHGVAPEMSDLISIVAIVSMANTADDVDRLVAGMTGIASDAPGRSPGRDDRIRGSMGVAIAPGIQAMTPREAFYAPSRTVSLRAAIGEVATEMIVPYPPGIPAIAPGEIFDVDKVEHLERCLRAGMVITGPTDATLSTIRIVAA